MKSKKKLGEICFPDWIRDFLSESDNLITKNFLVDIEEYIKFTRLIPHEYGWKVTSEKAFTEQLMCKLSTSKPSPNIVNELFWQDVAHNLIAWATLVNWRGEELIRGNIVNLEKGNILAAAISARSLIELTSSLIINQMQIGSVVRQVVEPLKDGKVMVQAPEVEKILNQVIFGTRLKTEGGIEQKNALTFVQKISKHKGFEAVISHYEVLCEVAHPNILGNAKFWADVKMIYDDKSELWLLHKNMVNQTTKRILIPTVWATGWAASNLKYGYDKLMDDAKSIFRIFPVENQN